MFLSESLAIASACCIALSGMLIAELNGRVDVVRLARWQMLAAFAMTAAASLAVGGWRALEGWQVSLLLLSGVAGIIIASTTYFAAIYAAGPRVTALLFSLTSPIALALGYLFLGETITARQGLGIACVLAGVAMAIGRPRRYGGAGKGMPSVSIDAPLPHGTPVAPSRTFTVGVVLGVITAVGQAVGTLLARPAMAAGVEPFTAMAVRSGIAAIFFAALLLVPLAALNKPYRFSTTDLGIAVGSAFFGTGLGMSLLMAALAAGSVGIVSTLSSMTPVVILPMVWLRTGVAPSPAAWAGAALAVAGTGLISL
ncbi:DMT family transporter [Mesorhizobium sp. CN2-181]|uniref:DMT family transporter n=1 Tax=Mesorhizobium yinganensis TaxID=3157707 RepID=UPI0032B8681A